MPALKHVAALALLAACESPTLYVGELELPEMDSGEQDAAEPDAGRDARVRDAQWNDGRVDNDWSCRDDDDCDDPDYGHCHTKFGVCVGCQYDRDCRQGEFCDMSPWVFQCRDHKNDPGPSTANAP